MKKQRIYEVRYEQRFKWQQSWIEYRERKLGDAEIYTFVVALRTELMGQTLDGRPCCGVRIHELKVLAETGEIE